jgi:hypothetical protein
MHQSSHLFPSFSIHDVDYERSMFKYQGSGIYDNPSTNYFNFRLLGNDPVDQSLQILRKLAEVKKLSEYICSRLLDNPLTSSDIHSRPTATETPPNDPIMMIWL